MEEKNKNEQSNNQTDDNNTPVSELDMETKTSDTEGTIGAAPVAADAPSTAAEVSASSSATPWTLITVVIVVIALLAGGVWWLSQSNGAGIELGTTPTGAPTMPTFSADDYPEVVAVVNGQDVASDRLIQGMQQAAQQAAQQGANPEDPEMRAQIESQTATALVNTELLIQAAAAAGIEIDESDIDAEIDTIVQQFGSEEVFQEQLDTAGLSLEQLREDFAQQLTIDAYLQQTPEWQAVELEPGEAQAFYDSVVAQNEGQEVPAFEEVQSVIEEQLIGTKQQEITQEIVDRLRADAEIEILI